MNKRLLFFLLAFYVAIVSAKTVVLRPNYVNHRYLLTQSMLSRANTKYVVNYDFVIDNDISLPENTTLVFKNGKISGNHIIYGRRTEIIAVDKQIFGTDVKFGGIWNVEEVYPQWFGALGDGITDDTNAFVRFFEFPCKKKVIPKGDYAVKEIMTDGINNSEVQAYGATLHYTRFNLNKQKGEEYGQILCNYTNESKPTLISHNLGDITILGLTIDGHSEKFQYEPVATSVTSIVNHHALHFICGGRISLTDCTFKNTFMTSALMEGCNSLHVNKCKIIRSGECEKYKPYGFFYTWEGIAMMETCYLGGKTQKIECDSCIIRNSYFEDIAGSYASGNCRYFESTRNEIKNNRGYLHEIVGEYSYKNRKIEIHDIKVDGVGSCLIGMSGIPVGDTCNVVVNMSHNIIRNIGNAGKRTVKNACANFYVAPKYENNGSGVLRLNINDNIFSYSGTRYVGGAISATYINYINNTFENFGHINDKDRDEDASLIFSNCDNLKEVNIEGNNISGTHFFISNVRKADVINICNNNITSTGYQTHLCSTLAFSFNTVNQLNILNNNISGFKYLVRINKFPIKKYVIENNISDAIIGVYTDNQPDQIVNCRYRNNVLSKESKRHTNVIKGLSDDRRL